MKWKIGSIMEVIDMPVIWPYYNPGELHTQDLNAFQAFDQSERAKAEDRMKRELMNQKAEQEAVRQAGMMEYNQLRASGMSPEDAYFRTASKINAGGGPTDYGLNLDRLGTSPTVKVEKPQFRNVGGNLMRLDPGATDWTTAVQGPEKQTRVTAPKALSAAEELLYATLAQKQAGGPSHGFMGLGKETPALTPDETAELNNLKRLKLGYNDYRLSLVPGEATPVINPPLPAPIPAPTGMSVEPLGIPPAPVFKPVKEIRRKVKGSNQVAIFDANTDPPTFLRYAD